MQLETDYSIYQSKEIPNLVHDPLTDIEQKTEQTFSSNISDPEKFPLNSILRFGCGICLTALGGTGIALTIPLAPAIAIIGSLSSLSVGLFGVKIMKESGEELIEISSAKTTLSESIHVAETGAKVEEPQEILHPDIPLPEIPLLDILQEKLTCLLKLSSEEYIANKLTVRCLLVKPKISKKIMSDDFIQLFKNETKIRITDLYIKFIRPDNIEDFQKTINEYNQFPEENENLLRSISKLKAIVNTQCEFYQDFINQLKNTYEIQRNQLHPKLVGLSGYIPSEYYSYEKDDYFLTNQSTFEQHFKEDPERFPVDILSANLKMMFRVDSLETFQKLKNEYLFIKKQNELVHNCLPKKYPINMPNLLDLSGESVIKITNEIQLKKLICVYTFYFHELLKLQNKFSGILDSKMMLISHLESIKSPVSF